jgi:glutaminase
MSVSKPFVFALVCQWIGAEEAREKLRANSTGLPFNSLSAIERSVDGRTNPMVNAGAIATTSLVPGTTVEAKWKFIHDGLSRFAGRKLPLNEEVYASASETNFRNQSIARTVFSKRAFRATSTGVNTSVTIASATLRIMMSNGTQRMNTTTSLSLAEASSATGKVSRAYRVQSNLAV